MPTGPGYWLDPRSGALYRVETHNAWMLDGQNQEKVGLTPKQVRVLKTLDPVKEIDEIRMVGLRAGLVRIRDRHRNLTMQFDAPPQRLPLVLRATADALPKLFTGAEHFLVLHNFDDDSFARVWTTEFVRKLKDDEPVMEHGGMAFPENDSLRARMDVLLG